MSRKPHPTIRPATRADLEKFYGSVDMTMRAYVGIVNGRIIGVGGVAYRDGHLFAFMDLKPSASKYKIPLALAARGVINTIRDEGCKVMWASVDEGAERWAKAMGFSPTMKPGIWRWQR